MAQIPISEVLKKRRHELGLSLKEAARRTGVQPSRLHDLEQGRSSTTGKPTLPTRENIRRIAHGYRLSEDYLLDLSGRPQIEPSSIEERQLLSHFKELVPGHRSAVLALVDRLYQMDRST